MNTNFEIHRHTTPAAELLRALDGAAAPTPRLCNEARRVRRDSIRVLAPEMGSPRRFSLLTSAATIFCAIALGLPAAAAQAGKARLPSTSTPSLRSLDYSGPQQAIEELDREIAEAGTDSTRLDAIADRLLGVLRQRDLTFAARQAVCQRLGSILLITSQRTDAAALAPLATMLANDRHVDLARLALEPVPGAAIDALFLTALGKASGHARLAIIQSIGTRRIHAAVSALGPLLNDSDPVTAAASAKALGEIGSAGALAALRNAPQAGASYIIDAKLAAAERLPAREARTLLRELNGDARLPAHVRAGAFRRLLDLDPRTAPRQIADALDGNDWTFKQAALEAIVAQPPAEISRALAAKLATWDPPTQTAAIAALGRLGHSAAVPAISVAASHPDRDVRHAALEALGTLPGNRDVARLLGRSAAGEDKDDAKIARQSLARLNGRGVSEFVLAGAQRGDAAQRVAFLEQLALRNMPEGVPLLLSCRDESDETIRAAALAALGDLGSPGELPNILDWTLAATASTEQSRGLRALVNVALRDPAPTQRGRFIYQAIEEAPAEGALRLLPALARIGGAASAECAARLALRDNAEIADAATAALTRWPDRTGLLPMTTVAEKSAHPPARTAAADGVLRYIERNREAWTRESTEILSRLLDSTRDADTRKRGVALLARANDQAALALAERLHSDPSLAEPAGYAASVIRANLAGKPNVRASENGDQAKNIFDGKTDTRWSVPMDGEEWLEIDFRLTRPVQRLTLDQTGRTSDFPERYEVFVTDDLQVPGTLRATGEGQRNRTIIELPANTRGRYVVIKNTAGRADSQWTVSELFVD